MSTRGSSSVRGSGGSVSGSVRSSSRTKSQKASSSTISETGKSTASTTSSSYSVDLVDYHSSGKRGLRRGTFQFDDETRGDFIFVPEYYDFESKKGFLDILTAMGIPFPKLVLQFEKNHGLIPNENKEELEAWLEYEDMSNYSELKRYHKYSHCAFADPTRKDVRAKVLTYKRMTRNVLDGISEVCHANGSVYLVSEPFRGNELSELACESASKKGVVSLGLFSSEGFSLVVKDREKDRQNKWGVLGQYRDDMSIGEEDDYVEWENRKDKQRCSISKNVFDSDIHCVPLGDEPRKAVRISCGLTAYEEKYAEKHRGVTSIPSGLANACSHRLVFTSNKRKNEFKRMFIKNFPTGTIAAGSNKSELYSVIRCLRDGRPLIILKGTGIVATAAEMFINRCNNQELNFELQARNLDNFIPITADIIPEAKSLLATVRSSLPHYNPDTYESFDIDRDLNIDHMKDRISEVFGTVFDFYPEVGGEEKDKDVLQYCDNLLTQVKSAKGRYRFNAAVLQILMRAMIMISVTLAITEGTFLNKNPDSESSNEWFSAIELVALVASLIGAALHALDSYARPNLKFATLLLTEARLESETYRFKTRTGAYRLFTSDGTKREIRVLFTKKCQQIFDECLQSDFAHGSLKQWPFGGSKQPTDGPVSSPRKKNKKKQSRESPEEESLRSTPEQSYDLEAGLSVSSSRDIKRINTAGSSKSNLSFSSISQPSTFQILSYGDRCLSYDNYIAKRLLPALNESENHLPLFTFFRNVLHFIIIGLTASCSLLVIFDRMRWIPLVLVGAATAEFFLHFFHLSTRVPVLNASTRELRKVRTWEQGLTHIQTRLPSKKNELVDRCEIAILSRCEHLAFSNLTRTTYSDYEIENNSN